MLNTKKILIISTIYFTAVFGLILFNAYLKYINAGENCTDDDGSSIRGRYGDDFPIHPIKKPPILDKEK